MRTANQFINNCNWLPFDKARDVVRKIAKERGITGSVPLRLMYNKNIIPPNVPRSPNTVYKNKGWSGWGDWLGTGKIKPCNRDDFLPYCAARKIVLKNAVPLGINTEKKWYSYKKYRYIRPQNIPHSPNIIYRKRGWVSWSHWLGTNNIRGQLRSYTVNDNFFKKWSYDMAYILGFWWADGYIRKRQYRYSITYSFGLAQNTKDIYLLKEVLLKMGANNPIYTPKSRPDGSHFEINSKIIFDDICKLGGSPRKSKTIMFPEDLPPKYLSDFIRGYFDGDGCITLNGKYKKSPSGYICSGNIKFIRQLKYVLRWHGICGKIKNNGNKKHPCYLLRFGAEDMRKLGRFMYEKNEGKMKLLRKYERFLKGGMYD